MPRLPIALLAAALATVGCGGADGPADPASLDDCRSIAEAAVLVVQHSIEVLDLAAAGTDPDAGEVAAIEDAGRALEQRAGEIGCTDEEMTLLMSGLADTLDAETALGQQIIESLRLGTGGFFEDG